MGMEWYGITLDDKETLWPLTVLLLPLATLCPWWWW
jgi:hypothetical protein